MPRTGPRAGSALLLQCRRAAKRALCLACSSAEIEAAVMRAARAARRFANADDAAIFDAGESPPWLTADACKAAIAGNAAFQRVGVAVAAVPAPGAAAAAVTFEGAPAAEGEPAPKKQKVWSRAVDAFACVHRLEIEAKAREGLGAAGCTRKL